MARKDINLNGQRFGRWIVLETIKGYKSGKTYCLCECDCGTQKYVYYLSLLNGESQSCGCLKKEKTEERCRKSYVEYMFGELTVVEMLYGYKNEKTYCRCICNCGKEHITSASNLISGHVKSCGCKTSEFIWENRRTNLVGLIFGRLTVVEMLYGYGKNKRTHCRCLCECGKETIVDMYNLLNGKTSSCGCWEIESRYHRLHYKDLTDMKFGLLTVLEKTDRKASNGSMIWKCRCDCDNIVYVSAGNLMRYHTTSCGCSKYSNMENFIADVLTKNDINYIPQARFIDCRNILPLPFDFYLYDYNTLVEFDGPQHDEPVEFFGGQEKFEQTVYNDNIKNQYCKQKNINLIRFSHKLSSNDIEKQLLHIWNP